MSTSIPMSTSGNSVQEINPMGIGIDEVTTDASLSRECRLPLKKYSFFYEIKASNLGFKL
jgi:hypothetical protein